MADFTPISGLIGGLMIGLAASALLLLAGRVAGISGILAGAMFERGPERHWRWAFVAGLVAGPLIVMAARGSALDLHIAAPLPVLVLAGLLVGFGARLGGGCTSGHGVCGVARLGPRSMVATAVFVAAGMAVVFVVRHLAAGWGT